MITAEHALLPRLFFYPYFDRLLKKHFSHFFLVNTPPEIDATQSLIITPNHFSWWDGFFALAISRAYIQKRFHLMMLEEQLVQYRYFRKLGAFSIHPGSTSSVLSTLRYCIGLLQDQRHLVVFYPQGKIENYDKRPFLLQKGLHTMAKRVGKVASILIVGFKINYYTEKYPEIIVRFGDYLSCSDIETKWKRYEEAFAQNMHRLDEASYERDFIKELF